MRKKELLRRAFCDETPRDYHETLLDALSQLPQRPARRRLSRRALLIAAIILVLLIAAAAVANQMGLHSQILQEYLGMAGKVPLSMESGMVQNAARCEQDGLALNIDEYAFDNGGLRVLWSVTSERDEPVFYVNSPRCEGIDDDMVVSAGVSMDIGDGTIVMLNGQVGRVKAPSSNQSSYDLVFGKNKPNQPITFTITAYVFTTDLEPVLRDEPGDGYINQHDPLAQGFESNNQIPVSQYGFANLSHDSRFLNTYNQLMDELGWQETGPEAARIYHYEAYVRSGLMKPLTTLTASITIDPSQVDTRPLSTYAGPRWHDLDNYTLEIAYINSYAMNLDMDIRLYPKQARTEASATDYGILICDAQYQEIAASPFAILEEDERGGFYYRFDNHFPPADVPDKLYLKAVPELSDTKWGLEGVIKSLYEKDPHEVIELPMSLREDVKVDEKTSARNR